ncbi:hypothetical protein [Streptomyces sp. MUM 136J]|uniref:hypothetical protein n=1 Tax=Streptomyces sp. MUM 136J TaxID=2791992 RepID=UPI001F0388F3|nr:hypothetical protein [Streptomyces sp. MUM 136J]
MPENSRSLPGVPRRAALTFTTSGAPSKDTTIAFRHAWSAPGEVAAVKSPVAGSEKARPHTSTPSAT